jgi:hypothetical protein
MILVDTDWVREERHVAVRLVVTFHAAPGKGAELAQAMKARCEISRQDKDQAALDAHAKLQAQRPPLPEGCASARASARTIPTTVPAERGRRQNAGLLFRAYSTIMYLSFVTLIWFD